MMRNEDDTSMATSLINKRKAQKRLEALLIKRLESDKSTPLLKKDWTNLRRTLKSRLAEHNGENET